MKDTEERKAVPRVSVIIPTYNYGRFLPRALASVFAQTFKDYEIIVVDDGSTDDTKEVIKNYGDSIRYIYQANLGQSAAQNRGIRESQASLIAFLDADDAWYPERLEKQIAYMDENPNFAMVFSDMSHCVNGVVVHERYLKERGYRFVDQGFIYNNLLHEGFIFMPTVLIQKECFSRVGFFDENLVNCQDVDMWFRVADCYQIGFMDIPLAIRHVHGANVTHNMESYLKAPIELMSNLYKKNIDETRLLIIRKRLMAMYYSLGYYYFQSGMMRLCRINMLSSLAHGNTKVSSYKYIILSFFPGFVNTILKKIVVFLKK